MSARGAGPGRMVRASRVGAVALLLAAGCHRTSKRPVAPRPPETLSMTAAQEWRAMRVTVQALMARGEHASGDSLLADFRARYPGTPAAADALLWRGLLRADPANRTQATREAAADLQAYESGGELHPYAAQAAVVRRLLAQIDSLQKAVVAERTAASVLIPRDSLKPRDDEVLRLRTELEQTQAELDRVRRRLAPPPPRRP